MSTVWRRMRSCACTQTLPGSGRPSCSAPASAYTPLRSASLTISWLITSPVSQCQPSAAACSRECPVREILQNVHLCLPALFRRHICRCCDNAIALLDPPCIGMHSCDRAPEPEHSLQDVGRALTPTRARMDVWAPAMSRMALHPASPAPAHTPRRNALSR